MREPYPRGLKHGSHGCLRAHSNRREPYPRGLKHGICRANLAHITSARTLSTGIETQRSKRHALFHIIHARTLSTGIETFKADLPTLVNSHRARTLSTGIETICDRSQPKRLTRREPYPRGLKLPPDFKAACISASRREPYPRGLKPDSVALEGALKCVRANLIHGD